jgi:hypothetical protein
MLITTGDALRLGSPSSVPPHGFSLVPATVRTGRQGDLSASVA